MSNKIHKNWSRDILSGSRQKLILSTLCHLLLVIGGFFRPTAQMKACNFSRPPSKYQLNFKSKILGKIGQKSGKASLTSSNIYPSRSESIRSAMHQLWINSRISYLKLSWLIYKNVTKHNVYRLLASRVLYGIATPGVCTVADRRRCI